jgi:hypothetical protein
VTRQILLNDFINTLHIVWCEGRTLAVAAWIIVQVQVHVPADNPTRFAQRPNASVDSEVSVNVF